VLGWLSNARKTDLVSFVQRLKSNAKVLTVVTGGPGEPSLDGLAEIGVVHENGCSVRTTLNGQEPG